MTEQGDSNDTRLHFRTHYFLQDPERDTLAILGSSSVFGCWDPKRALLAICSEDHVWEADANVSRGTTFAWKWVVMEMGTCRVKRWEERENRVFTANGEQVLIFAPWNEDHRFYSESDFRKSPLKHFISPGTLASGFMNVGRNAIKSLLQRSDLHKSEACKKVSFADEAADRICYREHGDDYDMVYVQTPGPSHGPPYDYVDVSKYRRGILRRSSSTDAEPPSRVQEKRLNEIKSELEELKSRRTNKTGRRCQIRERFLDEEVVMRYVLPSACVLGGIAIVYFLYTKLL